MLFLSIAYLAVPWFFFAWGWLWWPYACALSLGLAVSLAKTAGVSWANRGSPQCSCVEVTFLVVLCAALAVVSGAGGVWFQTTDWIKHNAVLHDLATRPWPVAYPATPGHPQGSFLVYYVAYYLPAAGVGRLWGIDAARHALLVWTFLGLLLTAAWIRRLLGRGCWVCFAGWLLLGGLDAIGATLQLGPRSWQFEWWAVFGQYSSNLSLIVWVPQHALSGWIATAAVMDACERRSRLPEAMLACALTALWSPFVTIGLAPLVLLALLRLRLPALCGWSSCATGPALLVVAGLYLGSVTGNGDTGLSWAPACYDAAWFSWAFLCFLVLEVGVFGVLVWAHLRQSPTAGLPWGGDWNLAWLGTAMLWLSVLPLFRLGTFNDLVMRGSIPCLAVLWVVLLRVVASEAFRLQTLRSSALAAALIVGAIPPVFGLAWQLNRPAVDARTIQIQSVVDLDRRFVDQYLGSCDATFARRCERPLGMKAR